MNGRKSRALFLTAAASGVLLNPLNSSMISLALHGIQQDLHLSFATVSWLISAFYLASTIAQPVMGRIGDQFGRKNTFMAGLSLVAVSALLAPWASTFALLLALRILQAIGSSSIYPSAMALVRERIQERQASALALIAVFTSATAAIGPTVGGLLIAWGGWRAIFTVNLPIVLVSLVLGWIAFPRDRDAADKTFKRVALIPLLKRLDLPGMALFALGLSALLWFLLSLGTNAHWLAGGIGIVCLAAFVWYERRTTKPFINVRMFTANRAFTLVLLQFIALNLYNYAIFFGLPSYFQDELHLNVSTSGLMMLFLSGVSMLVTLVAGRWIDRSGFRRPLIAGTVCMLAASILLATLFVGAVLPVMAVVLMLVGVSYGMNNVALQTAMIRSTPPETTGTASGLFQASRYMGSILSSVALGLVFGHDITAGRFRVLACLLIAVSAASLLLSFKQRETVETKAA